MSSLDSFLMSVGQVLGGARDAFGQPSAAAGMGFRTGGGNVVPQDFSNDSGRASDAHRQAVAQSGNYVRMLDAEDKASTPQAPNAIAAAGAGRARVDAAIAGAVADVGSTPNTEAGRKVLVDRILARLGDTKGALADGEADSKTRAADAAKSGANYSAIGRPPAAPGMPMGMGGMPFGGMPMGGGGGMPSMGGGGGMPSIPGLSALSSLGSLAQLGGLNPGQALGGVASAASAGAGGIGLSGGSGAADRAVDAALTQRGTPYSWGGGGPNGPGFGFGSGAGIKGLDCSSLIQLSGAAAGMHDIPRTTYDQVKMGVGVDISQVRKGDWVFSNLQKGKWEHVALAISNTQVVEAPKPGGHVQVSAMPSGPVAVRRVFND